MSKLLTALATLCICYNSQALTDFEMILPTGYGTYDEFIYKKDLNMLLTKHNENCYFAYLDGGLYGPLLSDFRNKLMIPIQSAVSGTSFGRKESTTLEDVIDLFDNTTVRRECNKRDIYFIRPDLLQCDFESCQSVCLWSYSYDHKAQWRLHRGETPTALTGPDSDHTSQTVEGQYLYLEAGVNFYGRTAEMISPTVNATGGLCVRLWYNMYGEDIDQLVVRATPQKAGDHAPELGLLEVSGNQGHGWKMAEMTIPAGLSWGGRVQLYIRAHLTQGTRGDIAIDDISSTPGVCPHSLLTCPFSSRQLECGWSQPEVDDAMQWTVNSGDTRTPDTGPCTDGGHGGGDNDKYLYVEGKHGAPGETADLLSPVLYLQGPVCFHFYYNMRGSGMGELDVIQRVVLGIDNVHDTILWTRVGEQGHHWKTGSVTVTSPDPTTPVQVVLRATRGPSIESDIAVDDLKGLSGPCEDDTIFSG